MLRTTTCLVVAAALALAACHTTVRTRVPVVAANPGGQECASLCAARSDPSACLTSCPGAVTERGQSCQPPPAPTSQPASDVGETCRDRREFDGVKTGVAVAVVVIGLFLIGALTVNYLDNNCPFC